jgi:hypothetical protein
LTLILSALNEAYVLQVGDRLVSRRSGKRQGVGQYQPFDELANKSVIYSAVDAFVLISYAGVAFVSQLPTDVWLAGILDADIAAGPNSGVRFGGKLGSRMTLGAAMMGVARELTGALRRMPAHQRRGGVTLQLVGWKWRRQANSFVMPILWHVTNDGNGGETTVHRLPRYWGWERHECHVAATGNRATNPVGRVQQRLAGTTALYADLVEQVLVDTIREASTSRATGGSIGPDCISTLVELSSDNVRVRYLPASPTHADYDAYTPWVVVPTVLAAAPLVLTGGLPEIHVAGLDIVFERAGPPTGSPSLPAGAGSLRRPLPPDLTNRR